MREEPLSETLRCWIFVISTTCTASIFWGAVTAGLIRFGFGIDDESHLLAIGLLVGIVVAIFCGPIALRYDRTGKG